MKHLTTTHQSTVNSDDRLVIARWLEGHRIDPMFVLLDQTYDIEDTRVTYSQYRHDDRGAVQFRGGMGSQDPRTERITHLCTLICESNTILEDLVNHEITEDANDDDGTGL